jgi:type I restriction enzyme R subunit
MVEGYAEKDYEQFVIGLFRDEGYAHADGRSASLDKTEKRKDDTVVVLEKRLSDALRRLNPDMGDAALKSAALKVLLPDSQPLIKSNHALHDMLVNGVPVERKREDGTVAGDRVRIIDFEKPGNNDFLVINQLTVFNERERRPDMVVFVNGLPLVTIELKSPGDERATLYSAWSQIQTYMQDIPQLFRYNAFCVISDGVNMSMGTVSSEFQRFKEWKASEDAEGIQESPTERMVRCVFSKKTLLDLIQNFIVYDDDGRGREIKKIAAYHQYYAVNNAVESTVHATSADGDGRCGVVWHTQGSGKSLTMVYYSGKIVKDKRMGNPTVVVMTDRIDLDNQLFGTFSQCHHLIRQTPKQAESRGDLIGLLKTASGGVVFTTINKFLPSEGETKYPMLSDRRNIVVIVDEAHRSQYDMIDGYASHVRDALPNASFIAFTGTPIDMATRNTVNVFGPYISIYDIKKSIEDGTTVPIYYQSRLVPISLPESQKELLDLDFENITECLEQDEKEKNKHRWSMLEALVGVDGRLDLVAADIVRHFESRQEAMDGKGMIVCMSRRICVDLYDKIVKLRPEWDGDGGDGGLLNVIMTGSASDPKGWGRHIRDKSERNKMAARFRDPDDPFKLAIVRDMWLTGFDVPSLHTMYIDKPMRNHGLMQAISRVNRVFRDKPGGLVVDYIGVADSLAAAVKAYTRDRGRGEVYIDKEEAVDGFVTALDVCEDLMHGYDRSWWNSSKKEQRVSKMRTAADFIIRVDKGVDRMKLCAENLTKAFYLATPDERVLAHREDVAFFQSLKAFLVKLTEGSRVPPELVNEALRQALSSAIVSKEPTDVLDILGYEKSDISVLSEEFLKRVKEMPEKNLAALLLERIMRDSLSDIRMENIVQSKKFTELLQESITKYEKRIFDTTEFINAMILLAKEIREAGERGVKLGLTKEELAFYDALGTDSSAVELMGDEALRAIARDVAKMIREQLKVDWNQRESVKAKMRATIKRVLKKHKYPPHMQDDATKLIVEQAELVCKSILGK